MLSSGDASAAFVTVHGSPTYTPGAGGYVGTGLAIAPSSTVSDFGVAVGFLSKRDALNVDKGLRAVRWDSTGAASELEHFGTNADGFSEGIAWAINGAGTAVGWVNKYVAWTGTGIRAVRWDASTGAATELQILGLGATRGTHTRAYAINDAGTTVGMANKYSATGTAMGHVAVRWDASGAATELGHLGINNSGGSGATAFAINDAGDVVGTSLKVDSAGSSVGERAVRWDRSGTAVTELGALGTDANGYTNSSAFAVNGAGTAIGSATSYDRFGGARGYRAVRWDQASTAAMELQNLGTRFNGYTTTFAFDINSAGTVVGYAERFSPSGAARGQRAVRWDDLGVVTELENLGTASDGLAYGAAYDINDAGIAVGYSQAYNDAGTLLGHRALYWGQDGAAVDINTLIDPASGWVLQQARGISDTGWVSGFGTYDPDGAGGQTPYSRLFLIQIPEPSAFALITLTGLSLARRRPR